MDESAIHALLIFVKQSETQTTAVDDVQVRYPTHVNDVAKVIENILQLQPTGVFHYSSDEAWTKFKICELFASLLHLQEHQLIRNIKSDPTRPTNVKLSCQKLKDIGAYVEPQCFKLWWKNYLSSINLHDLR
ncbi:hypothetical protein HMI55_004680 [Coelomomyces lativittatus]|nr:hypothetical protein HMI55_004680 [Coelomomyces lativittatus]KAJ1513150.1 hypothetical protein HMI56_002960 [Coelomomyces lativittatus]